MSRLLKAVLRARVSARVFCFDQLNLNLSEIFVATSNCSSCTSNQPPGPAGSEISSAQHGDENKTLHHVDRETRERERMERMRSRMRMLHGLEREHPTRDALSQHHQNNAKDDNTENDSKTQSSFTSEQIDVVSSDIGAAEEGGVARAQSDFIRRLKGGSSPQKKMDRLISVPFGLVRVDSMNSLQGRPNKLRKPEEALDQIENAPKSCVTSEKSIPKHDKSVLQHSHRELKLDEPVPKRNTLLSKHTELGSRQDKSSMKYSQSKVSRDTSESLPNLTTDQTLNTTAPMSSRNGTASLPERFSDDQDTFPRMPQKKTSNNHEPIELNIFDQQYFDSHITDDRPTDAQTNVHAFPSGNVFEEQYFDTSDSSSERNAQLPEEVFGFSDIRNFSTELPTPQRGLSTKHVDSEKDSHSIFDEQYFERTNEDQISKKLESSKRNNVQGSEVRTSKVRPIVDKPDIFDEQYFERKNEDQISEKVESTTRSNVQRPEVRTSKARPILDRPDETEDTIFHEIVTKRELKQRSIPIANVKDPVTAYDMAMKIRLEKKGKLATLSTATGTHPRESKWSGRLDSKGFRILTDQVVDMQRLTEDVVLNILKDSILYEDENVIAIDKPYGLPSHGGPGVHHSVGKFLEPLAAKVDRTGQLTSLHLVHRLDKETTGVMVLAKSQQTAEFLLALFKKRMVVKRYWAITKGIPNPTEGVIDIPMAEGSVEDRYRMELRPLYRDEASFLRRATDGLSGERREAVTNYKVLSSANGTALVECQPETGVKHQIRCHLAFGLNTPILGDHKYSHYSKMAPQRLYPEILQRLGIRQSKVRHLPMHLHARALVLPEFKDGRNLFLSARLPKHFTQNMKWLKLEPPQ